MKQHILNCLILTCLALCGTGHALAQAPTCNQSLTPDCLYFPATEYAIGREPPEVILDTVYQDISNMPRRVKMVLRIPRGATGPLPVVIWSHGGADGKTNLDNVGDIMVEWSRATAKAGYVTVTLAHHSRDQASREALCAAAPLGIDAQTCKVFKYLNWDRPHDISAAIDELERLNASGEFRGMMDLHRIAVGGHSAGAGGTLSIAGALRNFTGAALDLSDPRPVAFLAFSPQGPGSEGFFDTQFGNAEHSWMNIARPVLIGTGDGDSTCNHLAEPGSCFGDSPYIRRLAFDRMPAGGKYRLYVHDADTFHMLFELKASECGTSKAVDRAKCDEIVRWVSSAALAFLDANLKADALAGQWLGSSNVVNASGGVAEWTRK
jgi:dienelactone hydrolase